MPFYASLVLFFLLVLVVISNAKVLNVQDFGAVGDGVTMNTIAIEKTIASCATIMGRRNSDDTCTVYFPPGNYLTGPFNLTSNLIIDIDFNATILASTTISDFYPIAPLPSYSCCKEPGGPRFVPFIFGYKVSNVIIQGGGVINGQGLVWWEKKGHLPFTRPFLVEFYESEYITVKNVTLKNAMFWTLHPVYCNHVLVSNITIVNPIGISPNSDGIDPDSSSNVRITKCHIYTGDDHIAIKSGNNEEGRIFNRSSNNIIIEDNYFHIGGGVAIGSETSGGVFNVTIRNNRYFSAFNVVRIKSARGNGGVTENIFYENELLEAVGEAIFIDMNYESRKPPTNSSATTPVLKNVYLNNITGISAVAGKLLCLPESPCEIFMNKVNLVSAKGYTCQNVTGKATNSYPKMCF